MQRLYFLVVTAAAAVTPLVDLARAAVTAAGRMQGLTLEPIAAPAEIGIKAVLSSIVCVVTAAVIIVSRSPRVAAATVSAVAVAAAAMTVAAVTPTVAPVAVISAIVTEKPI